MTRHTTTGNAKPWEVAKGYAHESPQHARFERDEPPLNYWIITAPALIIGLGLAILEIVR